MPEFLKPDVPNQVAKPNQARWSPVSEKQAHLKADERLVIRTKMPNTLAYWSDLMLANAAFKSYNVSSRSLLLGILGVKALGWTDVIKGQLQIDVSVCDAAEGEARRAEATEEGALGLRARRSGVVEEGL
jgi:hypothetical protein